ncbi:hypothetical protein BJX62DRAFT_203039 [Aspergillus germanicus]
MKVCCVLVLYVLLKGSVRMLYMFFSPRIYAGCYLARLRAMSDPEHEDRRHPSSSQGTFGQARCSRLFVVVGIYICNRVE